MGPPRRAARAVVARPRRHPPDHQAARAARTARRVSRGRCRTRCPPDRRRSSTSVGLAGRPTACVAPRRRPVRSARRVRRRRRGRRDGSGPSPSSARGPLEQQPRQRPARVPTGGGDGPRLAAVDLDRCPTRPAKPCSIKPTTCRGGPRPRSRRLRPRTARARADRRSRPQSGSRQAGFGRCWRWCAAASVVAHVEGDGGVQVAQRRISARWWIASRLMCRTSADIGASANGTLGRSARSREAVLAERADAGRSTRVVVVEQGQPAGGGDRIVGRLVLDRTGFTEVVRRPAPEHPDREVADPPGDGGDRGRIGLGIAKSTAASPPRSVGTAPASGTDAPAAGDRLPQVLVVGQPVESWSGVLGPVPLQLFDAVRRSKYRGHAATVRRNEDRIGPGSRQT